jgi:hypothetical protein
MHRTTFFKPHRPPLPSHCNPHFAEVVHAPRRLHIASFPLNFENRMRFIFSVT